MLIEQGKYRYQPSHKKLEGGVCQFQGNRIFEFRLKWVKVGQESPKTAAINGRAPKEVDGLQVVQYGWYAD